MSGRIEVLEPHRQQRADVFTKTDLFSASWARKLHYQLDVKVQEEIENARGVIQITKKLAYD